MTLAYDPAMRLYQTVGAATTRFLYDGGDAIAEYNGSNALQRRFVFDPTTDQPVLWYEGTGTAASNRRYLSLDERGSVISVSDSTGASLGINTYDEYGKPGASNIGRFQYTGQMYVPETNTYHFPNRDLIAQGGLFAETDPTGQDAGPNLYEYDESDPINYVDPLGLATAPSPCPSNEPNCIPVIGRRIKQTSDAPLDLPGAVTGPQTPIVIIGRRTHPKPKPIVVIIKAAAKKLGQCVADQYGLGALAVGLTAAGQPIPGTKPFVTPGSSRGTSLAGKAADLIFGETGLPVRLPTIVGGLGTGRALRIAGTKSLARFAGRAVPIVGEALLAYDAISIAVCVAE